MSQKGGDCRMEDLTGKNLQVHEIRLETETKLSGLRRTTRGAECPCTKKIVQVIQRDMAYASIKEEK